MTDQKMKIEGVKRIDCPAHRLVGGLHYCGIGVEGDLLCWEGYKHSCLLFEPKAEELNPIRKWRKGESLIDMEG